MSAVGGPAENPVYVFGPFRLDPDEQTLVRDGDPVPLAPKAFQLLLTLIRRGADTVSKDELMKAVWPDTFVEETNLTRNVFALRKALGESEQDRYIITVPGRGYRFAKDVRQVRDSEVRILAASQSQVQVQITQTTPWTRIAIFGVLVLAAGAAVGLWYSSRHGAVLTANDTIVLADFTNSSGDPVFDSTLRQGMVVQLEQSPFLSLVPDQRIRRTLQLMGQPPDARLSGETAREVCERAEAAATIEGSIAMLGSAYVLGLRMRNCRTGVVIDEEQAQASRKEDVLNALSGMAGKLRRRAGESLATVEKYSTPLVDATTPSLEAFRAYSTGWQVHGLHGAAAALPFFQRAAEIDPQFAMAHASLGRLYADLDQLGLAAASTTQAWQLRDRASDREKFFIDLNYYLLVTGNMERAQQTAEAWARAYPREAAPHHILSGMLHKRAGRYEAALAEAQKSIDLAPDFWVGYYSKGVLNSFLGHLDEAEKTLHDASTRGLDADEFIMLAYDLAFLEGDTSRMQREAARARNRPGGENWMSAREAFAAAYSGRLREARNLSRRAVLQAKQAGQPERAGLWSAGAAIREALFGNKAPAGEWAAASLDLSHTREVEYGAALAFALSGDSAHAQALVANMEKQYPEDSVIRFGYAPCIRAALALAAGEPQQAVDSLQDAAPHELGIPGSAVSGLFGALYPVYLRGQAYLAQGKGAEAAAEFRKILEHRGVVVTDPIAALSHLQLGRAYALTGDKAKAQSAYQEFFALWKNADTDIPVLKQAQGEYAKLR